MRGFRKFGMRVGFSSLSNVARRSGSARRWWIASARPVSLYVWRVACMDGGGCAGAPFVHSLRIFSACAPWRGLKPFAARWLSACVVAMACRLSPLVARSRVPCVVLLALSVSAFAVNGSKFALVARLSFVGAFTRPHGLALNVWRFWLSVRVAWLFARLASLSDAPQWAKFRLRGLFGCSVV